MASFFSDYAPHGYCLLWDPSLVWTHVIADALIAASYFSIPVALLLFVRRRPDMKLGRVAGLFALFILSCGLTHVLGIWNLWHGNYGVEALAKVVTATASVLTAILLWRLMPHALALPSPATLQDHNVALAAALAERDEALTRLRAESAQRERAEAALVQSKKIEAVGHLTGGIAHDFNNLLQGVQGYVELIGMCPNQTDNVRIWAGNAREALERGTLLTGQLLTFSRQQRLQAEKICVADMLECMHDLIRNSVGPRIAVEFAIGNDLGAVCSDRTQLEMAVLNLALNARDAMPEGGTLRIAAARRDDVVTISVADDGIGMPDDIAERAFEPFFTTKEPGRGTGLGLSTVYGIAHQSGGGVTIDSKPGAGTTVVMTLPRADPDLPCPGEAPAAAKPAQTSDVRGSILLVDDDLMVRLALATMLSERGHEVHDVDGGAAALEELEHRSYDLLLLDFAMPRMNGAEVARRVLERLPDQKILFLSGYADSKAIDAAVAGRAHILRKPVRTDELNAAVAEMLSAPRTRRAPRRASARQLAHSDH